MHRPPKWPRLGGWLLKTVAVAAIAATVTAADPAPTPEPTVRIEFRDEAGPIRRATGRVLLEDQQGGVLLQQTDGHLWIVPAAQVVDRQPEQESFAPLSHKELGDRLLRELPAGFQVHRTPHYVFCFNTSREYAQWASSLFERLYRAFTAYWTRLGLELREPEFPMIVMVYASAEEYRQASQGDLGAAATNVIGYYSLKSNRVSMFDLTGSEAFRGQRRGNLREINQMLQQPAAVPLVATVVHEATHQIAFNCGFQQRFADIPLWLVEGMAVYFEAPDLASSRGWQGIGKVNYPRLETFLANAPQWRSDNLRSLVTEVRRLRDPNTAVDAYADAWALNYYLIRFRRDEYVAYLTTQQAKRPLGSSTPEERLAEFQKHFGPLPELERDFLKAMARLK